MSLNTRIKQLEEQVAALSSKLTSLSSNTELKSATPYSIVGGGSKRNLVNPVDSSTGLGLTMGGPVIWNNSELAVPPINVEPPLPTKGYNKHTHSRYSGGALLFDNVEVVEYEYGSIANKESQSFWNPQPEIKKEINTSGESVDKIGIIDFIFNPDNSKWGTAAYEIDIKKCYLVERDSDGEIVLDSNGQEKKSPLYNEDSTKTALVWDENAKVWRFYAVYAPGGEE